MHIYTHIKVHLSICTYLYKIIYIRDLGCSSVQSVYSLYKALGPSVPWHTLVYKNTSL